MQLANVQNQLNHRFTFTTGAATQEIELWFSVKCPVVDASHNGSHIVRNIQPFEVRVNNISIAEITDYQGFTADVQTSNMYYPFGMQMPGRMYNSDDYVYGFQGQEKDDEVAGQGNSYTAEYWQYDSRLGRRWNIDPVDKPWESSYACFWNNPIRVIDPNGDDGYVDEDGNYLGDDGDKKSHETRVINKDVWESTIGKNDKGELNEITSDIRKTLQTNVGTDEKGNATGTSKLLNQYEKGINISDKTWKSLTDKGGTRLKPFVENNSSSTIYYKPEGEVEGVNVNPYVSNSGAYPIAPKTALYSPVDGVKTPKTSSDEVHKVPTNYRVKVDEKGNADIIGWPDCCIPGYGATSTPKDGTWDALRDAYKR